MSAQRIRPLFPAMLLGGLLASRPRVGVAQGEQLSDPAFDALVARPDRGRRAESRDGDCMGLAFQLGRGRVVVTGEAAMLSAQLVSEDGADGKTTHPWGMNWPGVDNRQLALNIARWLTGALR